MTAPVAPPRVEVHPDADALATAAAGELLARLADAQQGGRTPQIGLTGGSIAERVHREVARLSPGSEVDWSDVVVWWGDERFVAADADDRNARQAREAFLDQVGVTPEHVHEVPAAGQVDDVHAAAAAYAEALAEHAGAGLDVLMLGVGPDGHCASLFPGHPALDVRDRAAVGVTDSPKPPPERVSLTFPTLNRARSVWFLVSSDDKAAAVASALGGADPHRTPAAGVTGTEETIWFLDRAAASAL